MYVTLFKKFKMKLESSHINEINLSEVTFREKSDLELKEYAASLQAQMLTNKVSLDDLLVDSFGLVREVSSRILGLRHFDTQLLGGIYLHQGKIAEMKTGEGKTLVASLPSFLNALSKKGVHIVTVNNYLAKRDQEFIGQIFRFLNVKVGLIQENMSIEEKKANYAADITYVTNTELAFDYLRDCTAQNITQVTQRPFNYCIVDEVDSILIDEARTPLILSNSSDSLRTSKEKFFVADSIIRCLQTDDYELEEKSKNIFLTPKGRLKIEDLLEIENLYDRSNPWITYINNSLRAHFAYKKNNDYIVSQDKIFIVDEFTGRVLADRRWSEGLHQAVEVKENVSLSPDSETFASITYQNFFRLYPKLSGMTGTAKTEEAELQSIYNLSVTQVPTYRPMVREDLPDLVYLDEYAKWKAIRNRCIELYTKGVPILVGTSTLSKSELLSKLLTEEAIPHQLLNARPENVKKESEIISQAGKKFSVTIATNMAGRGTDILLGGNKAYFIETSFKNYFSKIDKLKKFVLLPCKQNLQVKKSKSMVVQKNNLLNLAKYYSLLAKNKKIIDINSIDCNFYRFFWKNNKLSSKFQFLLGQTNFYYSLILTNFNFSTCNLDTSIFSYWAYLIYKHKQLHYTYQISKEQKEIKDLGGLYVLGTDRQDSRRIDNQLRGRSGRQGDIGVSQFFLSLDDRLLKLFADDNLKSIIRNLTLDPEEPIESQIVTKSLEKAQERVESLNFGVRKQLFEYDEVLEQQRAKLFIERKKLLNTRTPKKWVLQCCELVIDDLILNLKQNLIQESNFELQSKSFLINFFLRNNLISQSKIEQLSYDELRKTLYEELWILYEMKEEEYITLTGVNSFTEFERILLIDSIDECWKNHLQKMNLLKESVGWRVFAQKKPIREYKIGAYYLFKEMLIEISQRVFTNLFLFDYF